MSKYDIGDPDTCGRCGRHRVGDRTMSKDVSVHAGPMPQGYWYFCEECKQRLDEFLRGER